VRFSPDFDLRKQLQYIPYRRSGKDSDRSGSFRGGQIFQKSASPFRHQPRRLAIDPMEKSSRERPGLDRISKGSKNSGSTTSDENPSPSGTGKDPPSRAWI